MFESSAPGRPDPHFGPELRTADLLRRLKERPDEAERRSIAARADAWLRADAPAPPDPRTGAQRELFARWIGHRVPMGSILHLGGRQAEVALALAEGGAHVTSLLDHPARTLAAAARHGSDRLDFVLTAEDLAPAAPAQLIVVELDDAPPPGALKPLDALLINGGCLALLGPWRPQNHAPFSESGCLHLDRTERVVGGITAPGEQCLTLLSKSPATLPAPNRRLAAAPDGAPTVIGGRKPQLRLGLLLADSKPPSERYNDEAPLAFGYFYSFLRQRLPECEVVYRFTPEELLAADVDLIGVSASTEFYALAQQWARQIKEQSGLPVVVGGVHATVLPTSLTADMDVAVLGEGEQTLAELLEAFLARGRRFDAVDLARIPGLAYRDDGRLRVTPPRELIANLDALPPPDRKSIFIGRPALRTYMFTSRGCPYRCVFCASTRHWARLRQFSPTNVVNEIEQIRRELGLREVHFFDDLFIVPRQRLREIVRLLVERGLSREMKFSGAVRANLVDEELCQLLRLMNVEEVMFGAESFSDRVLEHLKCGTVTVADNQRAIDLLSGHGIRTNVSMIFGSPSESTADLLASFHALEDNLARGKLQKFSRGILRPYPGTPIWEEAKRRGLVADDMDWERIRCWRGIYLGGVPEPEFHRLWAEHEQVVKLIAPSNQVLWREWGISQPPAQLLRRVFEQFEQQSRIQRPTSSTPEVDQLVERAAALIGEGRAAEAEPLVVQALRSAPTDLRALKLDAALCFAAGRVAQAVRACAAILRQDPADADALAALQLRYTAVGDRAAAEFIAENTNGAPVPALAIVGAAAETATAPSVPPGGSRPSCAPSPCSPLVGGAPPPAQRSTRATAELDARRLDIRTLRRLGESFQARLKTCKASLAPQERWYPYGTMSNLAHLDALLTGANRTLLALADGQPIADIGAADGDLAFFLESLGCGPIDIVEHAPTNFNGLEGARLVKQALNSQVEIHDVDLDAQGVLPRPRYGLVFFLGILYHLRNPFFALDLLARCSAHCLLSTRIARRTPDKETELTRLPVAYLLDAQEANNDATNYWVFSPAGLERILQRSGWEICNFTTVGNTVDSDPASPAGDERAFCLLKSVKRR